MKTKWLPVVLVTLPWLCARLAAQGGGSIVGEVRDPSGAIMAGTKVTVLNTGTNVSHNTVTDTAGLYIVRSLSPGSYEVTIESPGFKRGVRSGIVIQVDQEARIDVALELGATTDTVNVTSEASITATETASNG